MRSPFTIAGLLSLTLALPALAQTTNSTAPAHPNAAASSSTMQPGQMQEAVKHDLTQAGFTDVQVMPSSFLVRAKDKAGRPVMMVINPDSVTEVTNMGVGSGHANANGSGTGSTSNNSTK